MTIETTPKSREVAHFKLVIGDNYSISSYPGHSGIRVGSVFSYMCSGRTVNLKQVAQCVKLDE